MLSLLIKQVDVKVFVKGEEKIVLGDVVSLEITIERVNNLINK